MVVESMTDQRNETIVVVSSIMMEPANTHVVSLNCATKVMEGGGMITVGPLTLPVPAKKVLT